MKLFVFTVSVALLSMFNVADVDCCNEMAGSGELAGAYEPPPSPPNPDPAPPSPPPDPTRKC